MSRVRTGAQDKSGGKKRERADQRKPDGPGRASRSTHYDFAQPLALAAHFHERGEDEQKQQQRRQRAKRRKPACASGKLRGRLRKKPCHGRERRDQST